MYRCIFETCAFHDKFSEHACANPLIPFNGNLSCDSYYNGLQCTPSCNHGYGFAIPPADSYFCDFDSGYWLPDDKMPIPDCSGTDLLNSTIDTDRS